MTLGILLVLVGGAPTALFIWVMATKTVPKFRASRRGATARGQVLSVKLLKESGNINSFPMRVRQADIEFTAADGSLVRYIEGLETGVECSTHDKVIVHYDPANPQNSATIKDPDDASTNLMVLSGVTLMFGVMFIFGVLIVAGVIDSSSTG